MKKTIAFDRHVHHNNNNSSIQSQLCARQESACYDISLDTVRSVTEFNC